MSLSLHDIGLGVLILLLAGVIACFEGCASPRDYHQMTDQVAEYGTSKIVDKKEGKVCYLYRDADNFAMQCSDRSKNHE